MKRGRFENVQYRRKPTFLVHSVSIYLKESRSERTNSDLGQRSKCWETVGYTMAELRC